MVNSKQISTKHHKTNFIVFLPKNKIKSNITIKINKNAIQEKEEFLIQPYRGNNILIN
jgi:intergrase/recombinase